MKKPLFPKKQQKNFLTDFTTTIEKYDSLT